MEHHLEELAEGVDCLAWDELNLLHEFFFHGLAELGDLKFWLVVLVGEDIGSVVGIFKYQLEFLDVAGDFQLAVNVVVK